MAISRAIETVRKLVPDLDGRISQFEVETFEMDDELIAAFCEELERMTADLQTGLDKPDTELIRVAAHSIKGMGGTMGLPEISVLAQEIELTLRGGQMDRCSSLCKALISWSSDFVAGNQ
ncbi:MAG TPA: Hpt domain-containing protein [Pontiellaceae bacterium]|nr:Hpt domain-containing protein [Pontiellaceae bacterium]HPR83057.1 Hpt domain-containing protein [Pontiellaceae bacterium]